VLSVLTLRAATDILLAMWPPVRRGSCRATASISQTTLTNNCSIMVATRRAAEITRTGPPGRSQPSPHLERQFGRGQPPARIRSQRSASGCRQLERV